ncbi:hypothetical protein [Methylomagnum sp.]
MNSTIKRLSLILGLALLLPGCVHQYGRGYDRGYGAYSGHYYGNPGYYYGGRPGYYYGGHPGYSNYGAYPRGGYPSGGGYIIDRGREPPPQDRHNHRPPRDGYSGGNGGGNNGSHHPNPAWQGNPAREERLRRQEAEHSNHWQQGERRKQQEIQSRPPAFQPPSAQFQRRQEAMWENRQRSQQFAAPVDKPPRQGGGPERGFKRNRRD